MTEYLAELALAERAMMRAHCLCTDLVLGVAGALIGISFADIYGLAFGGFWGNIIISTLGAMLLVFTVGMIRSCPPLRRQRAARRAPLE